MSELPPFAPGRRQFVTILVIECILLILIGFLIYHGHTYRANLAMEATATAVRANEIEQSITQANQETLKSLAKQQGITPAVLLSEQDLNYNPDSEHARMIQNAATMAAVDGQLYWGATKEDFVNADRYQDKFTDARDIILYGQNLDIERFSGRHMIWGNESALPQWLVTGVNNHSITDQELLTFIELRITQLSEAFPEIDHWSVVNELVPRDESGKNLWGEQLGTETVLDTAFRIADDLNPDATHIYNDFGIHNRFSSESYIADRSETAFQMIQEAIERGIPIDGVGMQMHLRWDTQLDVEGMIRTVNAYKNLGLSVHFTELNVKTNIPVEAVAAEWQHQFRGQAQVYAQVYYVAVQAGVDSVTVFGTHDEASYVDIYTEGSPTNALLARSEEWKPAYHAIKLIMAGLSLEEVTKIYAMR